MKKVKDVIKCMENFAPEYLKEDFDNVGLMVGDKESEISKILIALDCTLDVINEAKNINADMIITHHPLLFRKPKTITTDTLLGKKIIDLIKNDISLYSSHTNLDSVQDGLNHTIAKMLGFEESKILVKSNKSDLAGLGRVCSLDNIITIDELVQLLKTKLNINNIRVVEGKLAINKIAIINGSGQDFIEKAINEGAQCIITGDTTYHYVSDYKELGITVIDIGHFSSEWIVFKETMGRIIEDIPDIEFIFSNSCEEPYRYL